MQWRGPAKVAAGESLASRGVDGSMLSFNYGKYLSNGLGFELVVSVSLSRAGCAGSQFARKRRR